MSETGVSMLCEPEGRAAGLWKPWKLPARPPTWKSLRDSHSSHRSHRHDDDDLFEPNLATTPSHLLPMYPV